VVLLAAAAGGQSTITTINMLHIGVRGPALGKVPGAVVVELELTELDPLEFEAKRHDQTCNFTSTTAGDRMFHQLFEMPMLSLIKLILGKGFISTENRIRSSQALEFPGVPHTCYAIDAHIYLM
jgi:hypothetical protein